MTVEIDILTPADGEAGTTLRLPFPRAAGLAVAVWSRANGRPGWRHPGSFSRVASPNAPAAVAGPPAGPTDPTGEAPVTFEPPARYPDAPLDAFVLDQDLIA